jgi:hypothetical protein
LNYEETALMRAHILAALILATAAGAARAHGPQMQITIDDNQLVARQLHIDGDYSLALTPPKSVYVMPLLPLDGVWYSRPNNSLLAGIPEFPSGPGLAYGYDQADGGDRAFAAGSVLSVQFVDGLKLWNGVSFVDAGTTQLKGFRGSNPAIDSPAANFAVTSDSAPFDSVSLSAITDSYNAEAHASLRWALLGDGTSPTSASPDGVYLLSMQLTSTQDGLASSDPYFFLLHKNASADAIRGAVKTLGLLNAVVQYVPEPSAMAMLALAGFGLLPARRWLRK